MTSGRPAPGGLASRIAGTYPLAGTYHQAALAEDMEGVTTQVSELIPEATGLGLPGLPTTAVVGRVEWVARNAAAFAHLMEPARRNLEERFARQGGAAQRASAVAGKLIEAETTAMLSVLARKVLGQYELVMPTGESGDTVAYVGPNILQMERTHQFRPEEFRFWVALHELTHRAQFVGIPWLRDYFFGLVTELVSQTRPETGRLSRVVEEIGRRRAGGGPLIDERGLFGLFATPEQNATVDKVQALMSLLEGHGHVVMDRVGARHLRSQERMSRVLKGRRQDKRTAAFFRLTGLEMKLRQYKLGEEFVLTVEKEAGFETVARAFRGAASLPTLAEIEDPRSWLARVA